MRPNTRMAPADWPVNDLLAGRWSPRAISAEPVPAATLARLFEAARWAPSCFNEQPWRYVFATRANPDEHARLAACLVQGNAWAKEAWLLGLSIAKITFERNGRPNPHAWHDTGAASLSLALQASDLGLVMHQMAGFDRARASDSLGLDAAHEPIAMFALGWPGDPAGLPEALRQREEAPRERRALKGLVFEGEWGRPASFA